jgi:hypothetical protein
VKDKTDDLVSDINQEMRNDIETCLYSSLTPYAIVMSGMSAITALAAAFIRSNALLSLGFWNPYLFANLPLH